MQAIVRAINIIFSPILTLVFASKLSGVTLAGKDAGDVLGGAAAALLVLAVEIGLTQGPKYNGWLRRWLDPRAAFEGIWIQDVEGPGDNAIGIFALDYESERDSFAVSGHAYSANGWPWAKFNSTHMFIDSDRLKATYRWEGEVLDGRPTPEAEKSGLTELELRRPPALTPPMTGDGRVLHLRENTLFRFQLLRVTSRQLKELGLPFTLRKLRINAKHEERKLVEALLQKRAGEQTNPDATSHTEIRGAGTS